MSDYTKSTDFASKDSLPSGDSAKIVKGTEIDTEFNNISVAVATKADLASPGFSGTPSLPTGTTGVTQSFGDNSTKLATTAFVTAALAILYPVGSIYTNAAVSTNPGTLLGFGTWSAFAAGRVMVGLDAGNAAFDTAQETGGSADSIVVSHTHSATSTVTDPGHTHSITAYDENNAGSSNSGGVDASGTRPDVITNSSETGISVSTTVSSSGSSGTNANLPPYVVVYMWRRTA